MRNALFDVGGGKDGEGPEPVAKVGVDQHGSGHAAEGEVRSFGNAVLGWRIRDRFFVGDTVF